MPQPFRGDTWVAFSDLGGTKQRIRQSHEVAARALSHFYDALTEGKAEAALAASLFHFRQLSVGDVKRYLSERGLPIRLLDSG